ncbi:MAG: hypothetical protein DRP96_11370 [Candidatus Neomarinimicrobiota bacterium]|nr:MAG: hypothetical protein DRP96_11370 [Candidatus Neomarinimicrobiota bacterium]
MSEPTKKKQKVVLVITRLDRGGSAELTLQLAAGLSGKYYDVLLIYGKTTEPLWEPSKFADNHHFSLQCIDSLIRNLNPFKDLTAFIQLIKIFRQFRPDIVHTNSSKAGILGRLAARICGVRKIYHSPHGHIFYGYYNRIISKIFILFEKLMAHYTCKILNLTETGRQDHIREKIARPEKFLVSSCGIDLMPFKPYPSKNILEQNRDFTSIIWVGRIVPIKNLQMLLDALLVLNKTKSKIKVTVVGDGELRPEAEQFVKTHRLTNIRFLGYRTDIPELMSRNHILVLTSLNEGFGRVLVEAMACGLAIIATRVGGVPEIIKEGVNGFLVESHNHRQLAESISYLAENDRECRFIGLRNIKYAEFYSLKRYINRVSNIYTKY